MSAEFKPKPDERIPNSVNSENKGSSDFSTNHNVRLLNRLRESQPLTTVIIYILLFLSGSAFVNYLTSESYIFRRTSNPHCSHIQPIDLAEFQARQTKLAYALTQFNGTAYIAEPGANAGYFGNITSSHWHLSERPLLLVISPVFSKGSNNNNTEPIPRVTVLTPSFEATRAKMLPIPVPLTPGGSIEFVEWPEDTDPYTVLASSSLFKSSNNNSDFGTIYVDPAVRHFVVDGLQAAFGESTTVVSAPLEIRKLREQKSKHEIEIMKCANEATLLSIREVRQKMRLGLKESQVRQMMHEQLSHEGLKDNDCLTLFGENAALPHGTGTDRILQKSDFTLLDCGGSLHGYISDITRTFALSSSEIPGEHLQLWDYVHTAQSLAFGQAKKGVKTGDVDRVARNFLTGLGYGKHFTHRLGHGIGLEGHEAPYLRGGSADLIDIGHSFSDEPGIYIEGQVGIRLEDCFYIHETGIPVYFTEQAASPWRP